MKSKSTLRIWSENALALTLKIAIPIVLMAGVMVALSRPAKAILVDQFASLGREMIHFKGASQDAPRTLLLNGQPLGMSSGVAQTSIQEFVDEHLTQCPFPEQALQQINAQSAVVACFETKLDPNEAKKLNNYSKSDLQKSIGLGQGRFAFVEKQEGKLHFVSLWGKNLNPFVLMPQDSLNDAPGRDFSALPRIKNTRRKFSLLERDKPYGFNVYSDASRSSEELHNAYKQSLNNYGFSVETINMKEGRLSKLALLAFKGDVMAVVVTHEKNGKSYAGVSLAQNKELFTSSKQD